MPPYRISLIAALIVLLSATISARAETVAEAPPAAPAATPASEDDQPSPLEKDLADKGFRLGAPAFIRIFKADSSLELWMLRRGRFDLYKRYSICKWSGVLGPKLHEGDRQSPEGVYFITGGDLIVNARWHRAMNVGFPNAHDQAIGFTGSGILIHGKCRSIGCFALTDGVVEDVYEIVEAALEAGQPRIPVHIFPFELTRERLAAVADDAWSDFWQQLKRGYDLFMRDRLPPRTFVCNGRYAFQSRRRAGGVACRQFRVRAGHASSPPGARRDQPCQRQGGAGASGPARRTAGSDLWPARRPVSPSQGCLEEQGAMSAQIRTLPRSSRCGCEKCGLPAKVSPLPQAWCEHARSPCYAEIQAQIPLTKYLRDSWHSPLDSANNPA